MRSLLCDESLPKYLKVNMRTRVVGIRAYSQIMAGASWDPSCLTSLTAVSIEEISGALNLPLAATCTLFDMSKPSSSPDWAAMVNVPLHCFASFLSHPLLES